MSRNKPAKKTDNAQPRSAARNAPPPAPQRRVPSSEELFGRRPFSAGSAPRYYGTGVAGYTSGPGFTGGYYGYGDEPPLLETELEREYVEDVYGSEWESAAPSASAPPPAPARRAAPVRRYPPGPKGYRRSDERIREDLCERLMRSHHIDSSEVTVAVTSGKVLLEGTVPQRRMKHAIEDMADACLGVQDVENRIRVVGPQATG